MNLKRALAVGLAAMLGTGTSVVGDSKSSEAAKEAASKAAEAAKEAAAKAAEAAKAAAEKAAEAAKEAASKAAEAAKEAASREAEAKATAAKEAAAREAAAKETEAKAAAEKEAAAKSAAAREAEAKVASAKDAETRAAAMKEAESKAAEARESESRAKEAKESEARAEAAAKEAQSKAAAAKEAESKAEAGREAEERSAELAKQAAEKASAASREAAAKVTAAAVAGDSKPADSNRSASSLSIVGAVQQGGSDEESTRFKRDVLPGVNQLLSGTLAETKAIDDSAILLDPSKLRFKTDADVRVYFVGEGAGYANTLGFTTDGSGRSDSSSAKLIFPNASSPVSSYDPASNVRRSAAEPLLPGDFVNLGTMRAGSALDFFVIADGANGRTTSFSSQRSANPDGINHVVSFAYAVKDSPYLILGFEDLMGGGDRDFNDLLVAVDVGAINVAALTAASEPRAWVTLGTFAGLGMVLVRRSKGRDQGRKSGDRA